MGDSEQSDKAKEFDGYFEAWARTIVGQLYDTMIANMKDPASADDTALVNDVKRELLDAWHHRAGEGAPPECIAFIAEHSPMRKLDALPFLDKADPIGNLIERFEWQGQALLESGKERETANRERNDAIKASIIDARKVARLENELSEARKDKQGAIDELIEVVTGISKELQAVGLASENGGDGVVLDVRKMREELAECRSMVGALLGIPYTCEGVRETFNAWKDECMKQGRHIPLPVPSDRPTRPDAPQSHQNMLTLPPDEDGSMHPKSINITLNMPNASIKDVQAIAAELNSTLIIPLQGERSRLPSVEISYGSLRDLLNREASLTKECADLHQALCDEREEHISYQVHELFTVVLPDQERLDKPGIPSEETVRFRIRLIAEEFVELLAATFNDRAAIDALRMSLHWFDNHSPVKVNLPEFIDACGDLDVVVEGARIAFGVDGRPIARAIHAANMAKKDGPKRESDGKRLKPPGWKPADIEGELRKQGWQGNG